MAAFCSSCGVRTSPGDRFCGACGTSVITLCPTCGQVWEGGEVAAPPVREQPPITRPFVPPVTPTPQVKVVAEPVKQVDSPVRSNIKLTSALVDPVYGSSYKEKSDCPNCGAKGQRNGTCSLCGSEN